jgi:hypothetical protein
MVGTLVVAQSVAAKIVRAGHFETTQFSFAYQIQNSRNINHTVTTHFDLVPGQVDIINMEVGMDLISFHFNLMLNR